MEEFDDLDRALFALPLATPPPGMRDAILRSTIYAMPETAVAITMREVACIGAMLALAAWIIVYAMFDSHAVFAVCSQLGALARGLAQTQTLAWVASGAAIAVLANYVQDVPWTRRRFRGRV
jgi:hypothetical protein